MGGFLLIGVLESDKMSGTYIICRHCDKRGGANFDPASLTDKLRLEFSEARTSWAFVEYPMISGRWVV